MCCKIGHLPHFGRIIQRESKHVIRTAPFTQEIHFLIIGTKHRIGIFARCSNEGTKLLRRHIIQHNVAGNRGSMVLTPLIFLAFLILKNKLLAVFTERYIFGRRAQQLFGTAAGNGYAVQLAHHARRESRTFCRRLYFSSKNNILTIGSKSIRRFPSRPGSQAFCCSPCRGNNKDIEIAVTITGKSDRFTVGRPYRPVLISLMHG